MGCIDLPVYGLLCKADLTVSILHNDNSALWSAGVLTVAIVVAMNVLTKRSIR